MRNKLSILLIMMFLILGASQAQDTFTLTLLHTNDTHAHHLPDANGNGGVSRQATVVKQVREENPNTLLIDTGDRFSGTLFHTLYQGLDQQQLMNAIGYNVMTLGNHEFDGGDEVVANFISGLNFPVVVSNMATAGSLLEDLVLPYAILDINGEQIGIIGLIVAETPELASPSEILEFSFDYVDVANATAEELKEQGVNKIIVLAHVSYDEMMNFMTLFEGIDVVIGGDTHVLNSNSLSSAYAPYPITVEGADGNPIYYAQAGYYNTHMGRMDVTFDAEGIVTSAGGDAIWLTRYITPDPEVEEVVQELFAGIDDLIETPLGVFSDIDLEGRREVCRVEECSMGNLVADSVRFATNAQIGLANGGGVRASISAGELRVGNVMEVLPFANVVVSFSVNGATLKEILENGVARITLNENGEIMRFDSAGRFLQVSGLRYRYDPTMEVGNRITSVEIDNDDGTFSPLDLNTLYTVATNSFIYEGGDGFSMLPSKTIGAVTDGRYDYEALTEYLETLAFIDESLILGEPRITIENATLETIP